MTPAAPSGPIRLPQRLPTCAVDGCDRRRSTRGWCRLHYQRWQKYGDPLRERPTLAERVDAGLVKGPGCWEWSGALDSHGYGVIKVDGRVRKLPRVVWELHFGTIPTGLNVCHSCDNPPCANIDHLLLGTQRANIQDMLAKGRRKRAA